MSKLNTKTLNIAAVILMVLSLLFMATPLLRLSGGTGGTGFNRQFNGQNLPNRQFGQPGQENGNQGFPNLNDNTQGQGNSANPTRQFPGAGAQVLGSGLLGGMTGTIVYAVALLASLAAAMGMFLGKRWGQVLGILMAVVYLILGLLNLLPMVLMGFFTGNNWLNLALGIVHVVLAIAVIVLAVIPAKKVAAVVAPEVQTPPPAASA